MKVEHKYEHDLQRYASVERILAPYRIPNRPSQLTVTLTHSHQFHSNHRKFQGLTSDLSDPSKSDSETPQLHCQGCRRTRALKL